MVAEVKAPVDQKCLPRQMVVKPVLSLSLPDHARTALRRYVLGVFLKLMSRKGRC